MRGANKDFKETYDCFGLRYTKDQYRNEYLSTIQQAADVIVAVRQKKKANVDLILGTENQNRHLNEISLMKN